MTEPLSYMNGRLMPASQLTIPYWDIGFVQGVTIAEQVRTFAGRLFRLDQHLDRLAQSLAIVGIDLPVSLEELGRIAVEIVTSNHQLLEPGDDIGLSLFVTPGPYSQFAPAGTRGPTIGMHTYPVAFPAFADKYEQGERLVITETRQVPGTCWPPSLKCRSRMHYYLADGEARQVDPHARALLLDQHGYISEASTANFVLYRKSVGLLSPPREHILPGVSVATLEQLMQPLGVPLVSRELTVEEIWDADEAFLSSTSPCLIPVTAVNGRSIGNGQPGPLFRQAIHAWSQHVGVDIVGQAKRFAHRR